jgi:hypothetical protein
MIVVGVYKLASILIGLDHSFPVNNVEIREEILIEDGESHLVKDISNEDKTPTFTEKSIISLSSSQSPSNYPLSQLNLTSVELSFSKGFSQRMNPVPLKRWKAFSHQFCVHDHQENSSTSSIHHDDEDDNNKFNHRIPYALILGTQKGGTTALYDKLGRHPNIQKLRRKELGFFDHFLDEDSNKIIKSDGGISARAALQAYQETKIGQNIPLEFLKVSTQLNLVEATPSYLFFSDRVPARVFCTCPWVKLLVLLRNPVDRAFSQYNMQYNAEPNRETAMRDFVTFEEYVEMDMNVLKEIGVIPHLQVGEMEEDDNWIMSKEQLDSWDNYTKLGLNSPIGRGMYAIQLHQWLDAMESAGKDPLKDFLVIQSEEFQNNSHTIYLQILQFLQLSTYSINKEMNSKVNSASSTHKMKVTTKAYLEDFFRPYNRQLEKFLGNKWHGVWE